MADRTDEGAERPPPGAEDDAVTAALRTVEQLRGKRATLLDRIEVNKRASAQLAFAAFTDGGKARLEVDDYDSELAKLQRELAHIDAAIAEAERRHHAACAEHAAAQERGRAEQARERFSEFAQLAQDFSDRVNDVVRLFGELRAVSATVHQTGYGPAEAQIARWGQRLIVYRCQHDRNLRFEDMMADGRERQWLVSAPRDWFDKLMADTGAVLGPAAEAAE
jgi:hypothetical protein